MSIKVENFLIDLVNFFQLKVECKANGEQLKYAFYLYKDQEIIEKVAYSDNPGISFNLQDKGIYSVRVFIKDKRNNKIANTSEKITFNGFKDKSSPIDKPEVAIYGVSRLGAAVKAILETKYKVSFFIDDDKEKWGQTFFNVKIIEPTYAEKIDQLKIVCMDPKNKIVNDQSEVFTSIFVPDNLVTKTMFELSLLELYEVAKYCYLNGLLSGAKLIKRFIHFRFSSVVPYTAELGEGTRFGYGGIGVVIHTKARIGKNCVIGQNVTIGSRGETPIIGDNVFISPGAKCIGGRIGNNVIIGANAVVTKDVPDNCVVAGVPAKVISTDIEKYKGYFK
ncbi:DapH/DapD/GlmU-related protein [Neobacillus sp. NPDC093182]|uniref:serine O-acetyltransferase n=1 Tax=Neobacillus sp. NPDC093182 TaxID=3364297 RepID=UPI00382FF49F